MQKICKLFKKYKPIIFYIVFGFLTTVVNFATYTAFTRLFKISLPAATVLAWILAVTFAYFTNRKMVFGSTENGDIGMAAEAARFFLSRLATGAVDFLCMWIFADLLHLNDLAIKIAANILVIILNYAVGQIFVFKK